MSAKKNYLMTAWLVAAIFLAGLVALQGCKKSEPEANDTTQLEHGAAAAPVAEAAKETASAGQQKTCPIMGGPINKSVFVEYKGKKVYFCCQGCEPKFEADPEKYVAKLPQFQN
jgi:YHS domain-containing protein